MTSYFDTVQFGVTEDVWPIGLRCLKVFVCCQHRGGTCFLAGSMNLPPVPTPGVHLTSTNIPFAGSTISRQARRLYVGNIPFGVTEVSLHTLTDSCRRHTVNFALYCWLDDMPAVGPCPLPPPSYHFTSPLSTLFSSIFFLLFPLYLFLLALSIFSLFHPFPFH